MRTDDDPGRQPPGHAGARDAASDAGPIASMQASLLEMLAAGDRLDVILAALCRSLEAALPGAIGAICLRDDADGRLRLTTAPSLPTTFAGLDAAGVELNHHAPWTDLNGAAIVVTADLAADPRWTPWRDLIAPRDPRGCWLAPIRDRADGTTLGVVALFHPDPATPDAAASDLLARAAELACLAIRHDRADAALRDAETRYRTLVEQVPAIIYVEQLTGDIDLYVSPQIEAMLGYTAADVLARKPGWPDLVHPDDDPWVDEAVRRSDESGIFDEIYRMIARDGSIVWVRNQAIRVRDERGEPRYWHGVVVDLTERKLAEDRLTYLAEHDALTGLPNRTRFMERLLAATRAPDRAGSVAILFVDLDGFKNLNDSLGHDAGDQVLIETAARLRSSLRDGDLLARFGGDEFVILLPNVAGVDEATAIADRLLAALRAPWSVAGCAARVGGSIGIAVLDDDRPVDPEALLHEADIALYEAKTAGRATRVVYSPARSATAATRERSAHDPQHAMPEREAVVRYQPEIDLATGRIVRLEAGAYWDRLDGGLFPPANAIRLEGGQGTIVSAGLWALREACRQARAWHAVAGDGTPGVSVHLSAHEFCRPSLPEEIGAALAEAGIEPAMLETRISESTAAIVAQEIVPQVRALGVRVAIDDVGKRDVSLGRLHVLDYDALLLDASIVAGLGRDERSALVARFITTLGRDAGVAIGAKGVTTADQAATLGRLGVERAQGDAFSPLICANTVATLLANDQRLAPSGASPVVPQPVR